jgi:hemerythrin-like domain-containing protein
MLDIISYLRDYSDRYHHPREDVAFSCLVKRCPDMELPLARLRQEHRVIAHAGETLRNHLDAALDGAVVPLVEIEAAAATYLVYYGNHIAKEEEDVLTRAAHTLTAEDWQAVREAVPPTRDPLFGDHPEERYRELRRQIALEA